MTAEEALVFGAVQLLGQAAGLGHAGALAALAVLGDVPGVDAATGIVVHAESNGAGPKTPAQRSAAYRARKASASRGSSRGVTGNHAETVTRHVTKSDAPPSHTLPSYLQSSSEDSATKESEDPKNGINAREVNDAGDVTSVTPSRDEKRDVTRDAVTRRAAPIPPDWGPTDKHRAFAAQHRLDLELEVTGFLGRYEGEVVKSPNGRFSTWLANAAKWGRERSGAARVAPIGRTAQPSTLEAFERQKAEEGTAN